MGMRQSRYRGQDKTHLQFIFTAAAMNVTRAINWLNAIPRKTTQLTRFGRLGCLISGFANTIVNWFPQYLDACAHDYARCILDIHRLAFR